MSNPHGETNIEALPVNETEAVSGLLSMLLEQWDDVPMDDVSLEIAEDIPTTLEIVALPGIAQLSVSIENLSDGQQHEVESELDVLEPESLSELFAAIPIQDEDEQPEFVAVVPQSTFALEDFELEDFDEYSFDEQIPEAFAVAVPLEEPELAEDSSDVGDELSNAIFDVDGYDDMQFYCLPSAPEQSSEPAILQATEESSLDDEALVGDDDLLGLLLSGVAVGVAELETAPEAVIEAAPEAVVVPEPPPVPIKELGPPERFVVFRLAEKSYGIAMQRVLETDRMPQVTFVPGLPSSLRGITNLRGDILPIVDLRQLLGWGETELTAGNRLIVVKSTADSQVGLIVDALGGLGTFGVDRSGGVERSGNAVENELLNGSGEHKGQQVNVLDLDKVFTATELQELAA